MYAGTLLESHADPSLLNNLRPGGDLCLYPADSAPEQWSVSLSALSNFGGGEFWLGLEPKGNKPPKPAPFTDQASALNALSLVEELLPCPLLSRAELLELPDSGWLLHLCIPAGKGIHAAFDGLAYVRRGGKDLPCRDQEELSLLLFQKQLRSRENELSGWYLEDILPSPRLSALLRGQDAYSWLLEQKLMNKCCQLTVSAVLLFAPCPQALLPCSCGVRITRYRSSERDFPMLDSIPGSPITLEGDLCSLIRQSVLQVQKIVEEAGILGSDGLKLRAYPARVLHELITNAVLHRDYSIQKDIQIRIFTDRIEIESPGALLPEGSLRNPSIIRILSHMPQGPNRNIGRGMRHVNRAMLEAGLQSPSVSGTEDSVIVTLRHERLADAETLVLDYLDSHDSISNAIGREITGISDANRMKQVFNRLKDKGLLEIVPGTRSTSTLWRRVDSDLSPLSEQISLFAQEEYSI